MRLGVVMLAHQRLDRAAQLANALATAGVAVRVHIDNRTPSDQVQLFRDASDDAVEVQQTHAADWGQFGLVDATLDTAANLLSHHPDVTHVALMSGSCLPIRPLDELLAELAARPDHDRIESVSLAINPWVRDGLSMERFSLWHPFSHRRSPKLFSASVDLQRGFGVRRKIPAGLAPHLGMQWWCLRSSTLRAILDDPRLPEWRRFFKRSWIPDESFFQTVVRAVVPDVPLAPLHLVHFDHKGRPIVFHDDHAELLAQSRAFFARKIDPDADGLYQTFLTNMPEGPRPDLTPDVFEAVSEAALTEGRGLLTQARYPGGSSQTKVDTVQSYLVVIAPTEMPELQGPLIDTHRFWWGGRLFGADAVQFRDDAGQLVPFGPGNLPADPKLRDYRPAQFLGRLVHALGQRRLVFHYVPGDHRFLDRQIAGDGNARVVFVAPSDADGAGALADLRTPRSLKPVRSRKKPVPHPLWAWTRTVPDVDAVAQIAAGNIDDPAGWQIPDGAIMPSTVPDQAAEEASSGNAEPTVQGVAQ